MNDKKYLIFGLGNAEQKYAGTRHNYGFEVVNALAKKLGAEFKAAIVFDTSMEARTADKQGVTSLYTVTTSKALTLEYHDVFKRVRDGKIFRVTSDGDDKYTPASATLDMRQVTAEEFSL